MVFTLCSYSVCLEMGGGCLLSSANSRGQAAVGRLGGWGVGMGVNRLYPQLPGQDGDLAQASYRSFPPAFRIQNREERLRLGGGMLPSPPTGQRREFLTQKQGLSHGGISA